MAHHHLVVVMINNPIQEEGESIDSFVMALHCLSASCCYDTIRDDLIKDRIVCGVKDMCLKDRLLREPMLTLTKEIHICKTAEQTQILIKAIDNEEVVHAVRWNNKQVERSDVSQKSEDGVRNTFKHFRGSSDFGWKAHQIASLIEIITEPIEWLNPIVIVSKPNSDIRMCLDPQPLNAAILWEHYRLPTLEEVTVKLKGAQYFSTLDANKWFWQIWLSGENSKLTTFDSPSHGRIRFTQLPYGLQCAPEVFHTVICSLFNDIERVEIYIDDIIVFGKDKEKYEGRLQRVLHSVAEMNLGNFVPSLSKHTAVLRELFKLEQYREPFHNLKRLVTSTPVLQYFDPHEPVTVSVDVSMKGLGAVLFQANGPVAFAPKSLSQTQQKCAQVEKEQLDILYGCERFHQYIYGRKVVVETDHKPLEAIFNKPLDNCPLQLQCMLTQDVVSMLQRETSNYITLGHLKEVILKGWPSTNNQIPIAVKPFWTF
ncbi:hypothetical protein PR048_002286 [Dryococelus australis]|uniref:Reverse transcriptase domain-containing protein n=1 Tax=Dryococelus australis TaxID=614101 RepID=A0ABQ9IJS9_9NEOP|nr:hypothetical protein PR048_002286 [Dryococelus australis]